MAALRAARRHFGSADIVRAHRAQLESVLRLSPEQRRVLTDIEKCRTAALGGHLDRCTVCGHEQPSYNSCRNRHCPKCQALAQERWIEARRARMLNVPHFHIVFTLPAELRPLAAFARRAVFRALFAAVGQTLAAFARTRLSATLGATLVLHTWTRKLEFHPHLHAIVTAGGLTFDGKQFARAHRSFLFPVKAMNRVFRAKMLAALRRLYRQGRFAKFHDFQDPEGFARLTRSLAKVDWYIYAKPTFKRGGHVLEYLGRYTHRVGLANRRLLRVNDKAVTFRTKGRATTTVDPLTFLRRFLHHVLPIGFHKIRHIGLYASPVRGERARVLLGSRTVPRKQKPWAEHLRALTGRDVAKCRLCGGSVISTPLPFARAPPSASAA